jgi:DNA mismatch repair protein MutS
VPAAGARLGVCDRIFTRVGASDNLARGQSTFMVEMQETAAILNGATERSLVLLDEIGRGTATYDGVSIAWAVTEHIHDGLGAKTIFATHYHELTQLADQLDAVVNANVAVREVGDEIVFLRRLEPGGADRSYGIQVGRLAGLPSDVVARAKEILRELEGSHSAGGEGLGRGARATGAGGGAPQLGLFAAVESRLAEELATLDLDRMTPLEALVALAGLRDLARAPGDKERA